MLVFIGGGAGAVLRMLTYAILPPHDFPLGTWLVNISGSLLMGIILGLAVKENMPGENMKFLLATGFCGGFTTFSAFSAENIGLLQQGKIALSLAYILSSVIFALLATWAGFKIIN